ncbi:hypothetical protein [Okeania sp. SIO2C2]|uniref:hypothetical protein n=1 Tax=Okeania sp. SIO2C2 TaxID=2607787 RepID=UPI00257D8302|nr:hypothetical protein [Okeania sp. SIO2C2]
MKKEEGRRKKWIGTQTPSNYKLLADGGVLYQFYKCLLQIARVFLRSKPTP